MTFLPVVDRELRVASRRWGTYWARAGAAGGLLILAAWFLWWQIAQIGGSQVGREMFWVMSGFAYAFAWAGGLIFSADSISHERREGTLGLLFLTDLNSWDIVLGKLAASSLGAIYQLVAMLPVVAIPILLGGVTMGEYWRMVTVLMSTLFFSLALGMGCSVLAKTLKQAASWVLGMVTLVNLGAWLLMFTVRELTSHSLPSWVNFLSPLVSFGLVDDKSFQGRAGLGSVSWVTPAQFFWTVNGLLLLAGFLILGWASWVLPRVWQRSELGNRTVETKSNDRWSPSASVQKLKRESLLGRSPFAWLMVRDSKRIWYVWCLIGLVGLGYLIFVYFGGDGWLTEGPYLFVSFVVHTLLKWWVASDAPRLFWEDRRSGAMELYLSTPLTPKEMVRGCRLGLERFFLKPMLVVLAIDVAVALAAAPTTDTPEWFIYWLGRSVLLPLDLWASVYVGMWLGLSSSGSRTTAGTLLRVLFLPWILLIAGATFFGFAGSHLRTEEMFVIVIALFWGNSVVWLLRSRARMTKKFRELAMIRPGEKGLNPWSWLRFIRPTTP